MTEKWKARVEHELTADNLRKLLDNEIPAIRIRGFATPAECQKFIEAMKTARIKRYDLADVSYIGMAQVEYRWNATKDDYFADVAKSYVDQAHVFDNAFDPVARLIEMLSSYWPQPVKIAEEKERGQYFAGIIRVASKGIGLHADYAPYNAPGYDISEVDAQLGWNLFVEAPDKGGITTVHHKPWTPVMKDNVPPESYGLDRSLVEGAETFQYSPVAGDVVLFNSRNPHEVSPGEGADAGGRLQVGSFIGRMSSDQSLVLWA